jgi:hypothetical protein
MYINKPKVTAFGTKISISNAPEQRQGIPGIMEYVKIIRKSVRLLRQRKTNRSVGSETIRLIRNLRD